MHYDLMIIGESPSHTRPEGMEDVPFSGRTSHILWDELRKNGIERDDCFVTNVVNEKCPKGTKPTKEMVSRGMKQLARDIEEVKPYFLLTVGKFATEEIMMMKVYSLNDIAGTIIGCDWCDKWMVPVLHPAAVARNPNLKKDFATQIWTAIEALKTYKKAYESRKIKV